ncbi:FRIGIDA-like protein 3 [Diospyros lotus]|uniref:FRIGIDA-like protein 3 n=1 Tax=Diospyros lotus TaxID=55363 RepID=UPI00224EB33F|nr:FRIGIDA-like protein 3 [Diospyros lotus]
MADKDQVVATDATSLMEQLGKAFIELESHKEAAEDRIQWSEIEAHFHQLETVMKSKMEELEVREKEFKEIKSETSKMLAEKESAVAAKEQDMFDRLQELKDAAVAAIAEALANHQPELSEPVDGGDIKESKVSSFLGDSNAIHDDLEENSPHKMGENAEGLAGEVKPRPELTQFCGQMDAKGLLTYTMENQKNISDIQAELSIALESASEPGHLVLATLEGFYPPDDTTQEGDKRDAALEGMRHSCLIFMQAMATFLARADPGSDHLLNPEIKQQAKAIANEWKPKLADADIDAANGNSLEAEAFLQLLATFRIVSEFDEDELCELVLVVAHQRRAPELCRSLGLTHKIPGVVESLVNGGRHIDAVHFVQAFELYESFPPVPLLRTYLKDLRRNSQGKHGNSVGTAAARNDANSQELAALKAVIRCVKEYKLEAEYPLDPLQRRVMQLENSKPERKRPGESGKQQQQQQKKPRANGGFYGFRATSSAAGRPGPPAFAQRTMYAGGMPERSPHAAGLSTYDYQTPTQTAYAQQAYDQRSYYYAPEDRATAASYNAAPSSYGSYAGSGVQPSHQQYM